MKRRILVLGAGKAARQLAALEGTDVEIVGYMPTPGQGELRISTEAAGHRALTP